MIPLDEHLRPQWLFGITVHEGCDRAGYYEQGEFAATYDSPECLVKLGCSGQLVKCNVSKRGCINGAGGCPNVGGICIGCTMPGFSDMFIPFMEQVPIAGRTGSAIGVTENETYDSVIRSLREFALKKFDTEPPWRKKRSELVTGYIPDWGDNRAQSMVPQPRQGIGNPSHAGPQARTADTGTSRARLGHEAGDARGLDQLGGAHHPAPAGRRVGPPAASKPRTAPLPGSRRRPLPAQSKQHRLRERRPVSRSILDSRRRAGRARVRPCCRQIV
jgi:NiFe/NiFeSe hydrogenase small subunit C-terminal